MPAYLVAAVADMTASDKCTRGEINRCEMDEKKLR